MQKARYKNLINAYHPRKFMEKVLEIMEATTFKKKLWNGLGKKTFKKKNACYYC
jgi:hypothetical protein